MERLPDHTAYGWIESALCPIDPAPIAVTVAHCLPPTFERYLKLLHPIYEDLSVTDRGLTWDQANRTDPMVPNREGGVVRQIIPADSFPARRVSWQDLAGRWGREYHADITDTGLVPSASSWPRYLVGPAEGHLEGDQLRLVAAAIEPPTGEQECFFWWMTIFRDEPMWKGRLKELPTAAQVQEEWRSPNYVWPEDRSWCLCTDYDLCFSLIGVSTAGAEALLAQPELELLEVTLASRVDYRADQQHTP